MEFLEFISPEEGTEYIESAYGETANGCRTELLLDINMPVMTGWDFLERYEKIGSNIKNQFVIYYSLHLLLHATRKEQSKIIHKKIFNEAIQKRNGGDNI